ncbi:Zn(2)-C6 fungal-type domain-containing protein [Favolaschia claudopus]|uniref:Zn(2)-C6 fungal-type domain-containing protein n=1 Tax=Favolaschia claudopus TaxID=2862362 RepID=A0AAW0DN68_9AGAR
MHHPNTAKLGGHEISRCTTTPATRGRPRKNQLPTSTPSFARPHQTISINFNQDAIMGPLDSACPEITPDFVSHCFEGLKYNPQYAHPLITKTSIRSGVRSAAYQLDVLPPQSRVLGYCSVAYAALSSFHASVLGDGPRPYSFLDQDFFSSSSELLSCGIRRVATYRALRSKALKIAWEAGIILVPSNENAASCYLLDLMEQSDFGSAGRPWANAYLAHVRALVPGWRATSSYTTADANEWGNFLMAEGLVSARSRTVVIVTPHDQLLLSGSEPQSLEALLTSLEHSANDSSLTFLWASTRPYFLHVTNLSRDLYDTVNVARLCPLSEVAVLNFLDSLSKLHTILCLLLDRIDIVITVPGTTPSTVHDESSIDTVARATAYSLCFGFAGLALPFFREVQYRETNDVTSQSERTRERLKALRKQVYGMAVLGGKALAKGIRYLPKIHYTPVHWATVRMCAEFVADEAGEVSPDGLSAELVRDLETFADELKLLGYSLEAASTPQTLALIERLESYVNQAVVAMFLPVEDTAWMSMQQDADLILPWTEFFSDEPINTRI